jgi:hypothetical protein
MPSAVSVFQDAGYRAYLIVYTLLKSVLIIGYNLFVKKTSTAGLREVGGMRQRYIAALQAADNYDIGPLLAFARA